MKWETMIPYLCETMALSDYFVVTMDMFSQSSRLFVTSLQNGRVSKTVAETDATTIGVGKGVSPRPGRDVEKFYVTNSE